MIIAEGIESAWSVKLSTRLPAWAALSASGLKTMRLPSSVREVIVGADGDETGIAAAEYAARRFRNEGRYVKILQAPNGRDFNDELLK